MAGAGQGRREGSEEVEASESAAAGGNAEETGEVPDAQALLPINKPSIAAFQSLIDTFAIARDIRCAHFFGSMQDIHGSASAEKGGRMNGFEDLSLSAFPVGGMILCT